MKEKLKKISVNLSEEIVLEIDRICVKRKMTQTQVIRMMMDLGVDCHKDLEKLGLIGIVDFAYYVRESIKESSLGKNFRVSI
jgi:metal-responsive CopG/Arc/MetJ family transcriptional regulator